MCSRSITTEVSIKPCDARAISATRHDRLVGRPIEVCSQSLQLDRRRASECGYCRLGADEPVAAQRQKLTDGNPIPGHNEGCALVELTHNLAAVIAQLALGDLSIHTCTVAHVLRKVGLVGDGNVALDAPRIWLMDRAGPLGLFDATINRRLAGEFPPELRHRRYFTRPTMPEHWLSAILENQPPYRERKKSVALDFRRVPETMAVEFIWAIERQVRLVCINDNYPRW
jgi:hypothetical protein